MSGPRSESAGSLNTAGGAAHSGLSAGFTHFASDHFVRRAGSAKGDGSPANAGTTLFGESDAIATRKPSECRAARCAANRSFLPLQAEASVCFFSVELALLY